MRRFGHAGARAQLALLQSRRDFGDWPGTSKAESPVTSATRIRPGRGGGNKAGFRRPGRDAFGLGGKPGVVPARAALPPANLLHLSEAHLCEGFRGDPVQAELGLINLLEVAVRNHGWEKKPCGSKPNRRKASRRRSHFSRSDRCARS